MGVLGLTPFILKTCPEVIKQLPDRLRGLTGKTIVIDGTLVTQRLHFAQAPHPYRHILGWYRIIKEFNDNGVNAICVFDGKERSLAKAREAERRKEVQRLATSRASIEIDRLQRLRRLVELLDYFRSLDDSEQQRVTSLFREMIWETDLLSKRSCPPWDRQNGRYLDLLRYVHDFVNSKDHSSLYSPVSRDMLARAYDHKSLPDQVEQLPSSPLPDSKSILNSCASQDHLDFLQYLESSFADIFSHSAPSHEADPSIDECRGTPQKTQHDSSTSLDVEHEPLPLDESLSNVPVDFVASSDEANTVSAIPLNQDTAEVSSPDGNIGQGIDLHSLCVSDNADAPTEPKSLSEPLRHPLEPSKRIGVIPDDSLPVHRLATGSFPLSVTHKNLSPSVDQPIIMRRPFPHHLAIDLDQPHPLYPEASDHLISAKKSTAIADILTALASLYIDYWNSIPKLISLSTPSSSSLPSTTPTTTSHETEDTAEAYIMTKSQYQLTLDEGKLWKELAASGTRDPSAIDTQAQNASTMEINLASLTEKSSLMSESYQRRSNPPTTQTYDECKEILYAMGVPCIEPAGNFEGEALASALVIRGLADYVASEDTDVLVYGATLIRNITNRHEPLIIISNVDVRTVLQLEQDSFIDFALLLGTDFSQRIKNIGPARALKFIKEHGSIERVIDLETKFPLRIPKHVYLEQVKAARVVFRSLPPVPDQKLLEPSKGDHQEVLQILQRHGLHRAAMYDWDYEAALDGNYFEDDPRAY